MTLIKRLDKARTRIEKSYKEGDYVDLAKCCNNFKGLYNECIKLGSKSKEYHYAEYLKLLMLHYFNSMFDTIGESYELYEQSQTSKWKAGLIANKYSGKYINENVYA